MQARGDSLTRDLPWLVDLGVSACELADLNPCVPGEFTLPDALYVNTGSPGQMYQGTEEGTLPLVAGRWYLIPQRLAMLHPNLVTNTASVARAPRLIR